MNEGAYTDIDDSPSKTFIIENYEVPKTSKYFELAYSKRPKVELYNVKEDPHCLNNLAGVVKYKSIENSMKEKLMRELRCSQDPRVASPAKDVFDCYIRYSAMRKFPKPKWT